MSKNILLAAASFLMIAGSAAATAHTAISALPVQPVSKAATLKAMIPPPTCPMHTPNGCGIYE